MTVRGRLLLAASWLACRLPERPLFRLAGLAGDLWYRLAPGRAAPGPPEPAARVPGAGRVRTREPARPAPPRRTRRRSSGSSARRSGTPPATTSRSRATRASPASSSTSDSALDTPELIAEAVVPGKAVLFVGLHFGSVELAVLFLAFRVGETVIPMETIDDPGPAGLLRADAGSAGVRLVGLQARRAGR